MSPLVVAPGGPLVGGISVPGDKSISHRVLMLAALADGTSTVRGLSDGGDVACTRRIVEALGAGVVDVDDDTISVRGGSLGAVDHPLDVGNSGTGIRLLAGLLAGLPFRSVLDGDASIRRRPMDRILEPLRLMGATVAGHDGLALAPLDIRGGGLRGIEYRLPVASGQVKGCVLFAGLSADGPTTVIEDRPSRAHTEELMAAAKQMGAPVDLVRYVHEHGKLPVPNFAAGGVATPPDAALCRQLGAESVFSWDRASSRATTRHRGPVPSWKPSPTSAIRRWWQR